MTLRLADVMERPKPRAAAALGLPAVTRRQVKTSRVSVDGIAESFDKARREAKLRYRSAEESEYRPDRRLVGGMADAHLWEWDIWLMRERIRELDRDAPILGQLVERGCDQILGTGLRIDPQTGSKVRDDLVRAMWQEWASNPEACDFTGRESFDGLERLALRHMWVDGDAFGVLNDRSGTVLLEEGDRVTSPTNYYVQEIGGREREVVIGVELDPSTRRPTGYHFLRYVPGERQRIVRRVPAVGTDDLVRIDARHVVHVLQRRRVSQTRGVSAFHAVMDRLYMLDDVEFAQLVQQQVASCIAAFVYSDVQGGFGTERDESIDGETLTFSEMRPGMIEKLPPGHRVDGFSPTIAPPDAREQAKQIVREIGLAIGLPLELSLLITSDTTFHGYRGVVEAYRQTARVIRARFAAQFRSRVYRWKVRQWVEAGLLPAHPRIEAHTVHGPAWGYVDPKVEAEADATRLDKHLASPRQVWAERGRDYEDGVREIVEDAAAKVRLAAEVAEQLKADGVEDVTWRDVLDPELGASIQAAEASAEAVADRAGAPGAEEQPEEEPATEPEEARDDDDA